MTSPTHNSSSWIAHWARCRGDRPALMDGDRRLSYAELEDRVARLAGHLLAQGIGQGDRVAILLTNRTAYLEAVFAVSRIGAICLPMNTRLSPREVAFLLGDCQPAAIVLENDLVDLAARAYRVSRHTPGVELRTGGEDDAYERALAAATPESRSLPLSPDDPMILMYTSGTTGSPKGALLPHRKALFNSLNAQHIFGTHGDDRVLVASPLFHSLGLQIISIPVFYAGGCVVLRPRFDAQSVWDAVESERVTYFGAVPTVHQRLADWLDERRATPGQRPVDLSSVRFCFTAGSAIPIETIHRFQAHDLVLKQGYGQTETSMLCCLEERDAVRKAGSVGRSLFHAELRVVATDAIAGPPSGWRDVAEEERGEIVVRGPITMLRYWEREQATAETLREDGWLRTNDLATVDDEGFITLCGRARDMYISGGENVYPAEVEAVYTEHPAIREIAVVGIPDSRWGETGRAHVVLADDVALDSEALLAWGRERLARFKLPARFVQELALPRTATGKVQKHRLADEGGAP